MISNVDPLLPAGTLPALPRRRRAPSPFRYRSIHHVAAGPREAVADADPIPHFSVEADMASAYAAGSAWLLRLAGRGRTRVTCTSTGEAPGVWRGAPSVLLGLCSEVAE